MVPVENRRIAGKFPPGVSGNPAGRPVGALNRTSRELRKALRAALGGEIDQLPNLLAELEPRERVELLAKLLRYVAPIPQSVGIEGKGLFADTE